MKKHKVIIRKHGGSILFEKEVRAPDHWSETAVQTVAHKYMGPDENSVEQMIDRVVNWFKSFLGNSDAQLLKTGILNQCITFNSPVWFNAGFKEKPQTAACYLLGIEDDLDFIEQIINLEATIYRNGSGVGINLSRLRAKGEPLSKGGSSSGPVSFLKVMDTNASVIKSGGRMRRAARLTILNINHPDIEEFINIKAVEEDKLRALVDAGFEIDWTNTYDYAYYQNTNISVRIFKDFFEAIEKGEKYPLKYIVKNGEKLVDPKKLLRQIAEAAWKCGDPGIDFHDTINAYNTVAETTKIWTENACGEIKFVDWSACNLATINLARFFDLMHRKFDFNLYEEYIRLLIRAQDRMIDFSYYPGEERGFTKIASTVKFYRPLGLNYTNLGYLLMLMGVPYDSDQGRAIAAGLASFMTAVAYHESSMIAKRDKPCKAWESNKHSLLNVLTIHKAASQSLDLPSDWKVCLNRIWEKTIKSAEKYGVSNMQVTCMAPTGTVSFMLDAYTTGIEPEFSLVKTKYYSDGSVKTFINPAIRPALEFLLKDSKKIDKILKQVAETGVIETGHPDIDKVFQTAVGSNALKPEAHIDMVASIQPVVSGGISKTINLPEDTTPEKIEELIWYSWKAGLKSVTFYRDKSKVYQPLEKGKVRKSVHFKREKELASSSSSQKRVKLPDTRKSITHKFSIQGLEGYITVGLYPDGKPGEIFIKAAKQGSTLEGLLDGLAIAISLGLQYGVPLEAYIDKYKGIIFEPAGIVPNKDIRNCTSILDYLAKWLEQEFVKKAKEESSLAFRVCYKENDFKKKEEPALSDRLCPICGSMLIRTGTCYYCPNCQYSGGCE